MHEIPVLLVVHIIASILFAVLSRIAKRLAKKVRPADVSRRKEFVRFVYAGRFFDFYLGHARPFFFSNIAFVLLLNLLGTVFIRHTQGILFLDTAGTALAAFALGPWWAAIVGILTNSLGALLSGAHYHQFGIVNALLGIAWGYYAIWRRKNGGRLGDYSARQLIKTVLIVGLIGVVVSTPLSTYLLSKDHAPDGTVVNVNATDNFHLQLYEVVSGHSDVSTAADQAVFMACQIPFNAADKILSAIIAIALLQFLFPMVRIFETLKPTINFINSSAGSHVAFIAIYAVVFMFFDFRVPLWLTLVPIACCMASYCTMALYVPARLKPYYILAEYFSDFRLPDGDALIRRRFLRTTGVAVIAIAGYLVVLLLALGWFVTKDDVYEVLRSVLTAVTVLLLFLFAAANMFFLAWDLHSNEGDLAARINATD